MLGSVSHCNKLSMIYLKTDFKFWINWLKSLFTLTIRETWSTGLFLRYFLRLILNQQAIELWIFLLYTGKMFWEINDGWLWHELWNHSDEFLKLLHWNPLVYLALWINILHMYNFTMSLIGHLENPGSLRYTDLPYVNIFHYTNQTCIYYHHWSYERGI